MEKNVSFKISAALKNLIGKELITDQYIAIFELVKNCFDAYAKEVTIIFENIYQNNSRIIIKDNGNGMDYNDLVNKWLFVAYSAKHEGTEDHDLSVNSEKQLQTKEDYRNRIQSKRLFAGAKGVGRFSCDRLGSKLNLITIKNKEKSNIENLRVDWDQFEKSAKEEFVNVSVKYNRLSNHSHGIEHGTVLEITELRDKWDRKSLVYLRKSLEKLINPNQGNDSGNFSIQLIVKDEEENDKNKKDTGKINGFITNTVFETMNLKTTQIITKISDDGKYIITTLKDRGKLIYTVTEENHYSIKDIDVHLFYLNREAKLNFTRIMGIESVKYGSVFLYKNGFRIYPFGEEGEDSLGLDRRKAQGYNRFLGTRDLIGRIEINGETEDLKETTSRDGGLLKNESYHELVDFFGEKALKRLEKYVVEIIKWGDPYKLTKDDQVTQPALNPEDVKTEILNYISRLTRPKEIIDVQYNNDFLELVEKSSEKSTINVLKRLSQRAYDSNDIQMKKEISKVEKDIVDLIGVNNELESEVFERTKELKESKKVLEHTTKQNLFLKSISSTETKEVISLQHHIDHSTVRIKRNINLLKSAIQRKASIDEMLNYVDKISLENNKISTITRFVTKANFDLMSKEITNDLVEFVNQYVENVYKEYKHLILNNQLLNIYLDVPQELQFEYKFKPLEFIIIIDNLLNNSYKANAKNVWIKWQSISNNEIHLSFIDDGKGISSSLLDKIFEFGFTTTDGSGIGLYHCKQIIEKMGGFIEVNNKLTQGVEFVLGVKR